MGNPIYKKYSLTYPQCSLNKEHAGEQLKLLKGAEAVVVAQECHKDGANHLHVFIEFEKKGRRSPDSFDIEGNHPNVQGCRNVRDWIKYITKEDKTPWCWHFDIKACTEKKSTKLSVKRCATMPYEELRKKIRPDQLQRTLAGIQLDKLMTAEIKDLSKPCGIWIQGQPGVGKSYDVRVYSKLSGMGLYEKAHNKWWDGYSGEEIVLIDDVHESEKTWITTFLKIWADAYAFKAETKGGMMSIRPKWLVVTSNFGIESMAELDIDQQAIRRRFQIFYIHEFNGTFSALTETIGPIVIPPTPEEEAKNDLSIEEPSDLPLIDDPPGLLSQIEYPPGLISLIKPFGAQ